MTTADADFPFTPPPDKRGIKAIFSEMDPLEGIFLLVCALSSIGQIFSGARPGSLEAVLPQAFQNIWLIVFSLGAFIGMTGICWLGRRLDAILIESVGLAWVGLTLVIYGFAQIIAAFQIENVGGALMAGPLTIVLGIAFFWKHRRIQRVLDRLKT